MVTSRQQYPVSIRRISWFYRLGLLILSLFCTLFFIAGQLDRPRIEQVRQQDRAAAEQATREMLDALEENTRQRLERLRRTERETTGSLEAQYRERVEKLQARLEQEMNNVVRGQFKGPRYREIERRLDREKRALATMLQGRGERLQRLEEALLAEKETKRAQILENEKRILADIAHARYEADERAGDPRIIAFINLVEGLTGKHPGAEEVIFCFAILLALLLESGIVLSFDLVTVTVAPVMRAQHDSELDKKIFGARASTEAEREAAEHEMFLQRLNKRARATMEAAEHHFSEAGAQTR